MYYLDLSSIEQVAGVSLTDLPYSARLLVESAARVGGIESGVSTIKSIAHGRRNQSIEMVPVRLIMQDFTAVPALVDLADARSTRLELNEDPTQVSSRVPVDVVVDHSVIVDYWGSADALAANEKREIERNGERYEFLKWAGDKIGGVTVHPPGSGIVHQLNLERFALPIRHSSVGNRTVVHSDFVCGTDSHTTMINGIGILGWGIGGLEAEAVMLGRPIVLRVPSFTAIKLIGVQGAGISASDIVLHLTSVLRRIGVVEAFVDFFDVNESLSVNDRATIANMAPEFGATCALFPVDSKTMQFYRETGRDEELIELAEAYYRRQNFWLGSDRHHPAGYDQVIEIDLSMVEPTIAGPRDPHSALTFAEVPHSLGELDKRAQGSSIGDGDIVMAAIASCTMTSNPHLVAAAGLLARNAVARGMRVPSHVKCSFSPGSAVVTDYLDAAGLSEPLARLGFGLVGYGCMACNGNGGALAPEIELALRENQLKVASVISGNRNFDGRLHSGIAGNYLASPALVVAYALAGTMAISLNTDVIGIDRNGECVRLADIWPSDEEISAVAKNALSPTRVRASYAALDDRSDPWKGITGSSEETFPWRSQSTYVSRPPWSRLGGKPSKISGYRVLLHLGDNVTTDHISPGGPVLPSSVAGLYLQELGVARRDLNVYGARRGNHEVMARGAFTNGRLKNGLSPNEQGGWTKITGQPDSLPVFDAAAIYKASNTGVVIVAGGRYGAGSSRDWAAKATRVLGVSSVLAMSFERIHRTNLVHCGVLPLQCIDPEIDLVQLDISPDTEVTVHGRISPGSTVEVELTSKNGSNLVKARVRLDTEDEFLLYRKGGLLASIAEIASEELDPKEEASS